MDTDTENSNSSKITFTLNPSDSGNIEITANPTDTLQSVLNQNSLNGYNTALYSGQLIDLTKSISELGVEGGSGVIIYKNDLKEEPEKEILPNKESPNNIQIRNMMMNQNNSMQSMADMIMNNYKKMNIPLNNTNVLQQGQQSSSQFINIIFRVGEQLQPQQDAQVKKTIIQCNLNDKISDIVHKYRTKSLDTEEKKFVYNAKTLDLKLTAAEAGLVDNANIYVLNTKNVMGG